MNKIKKISVVGLGKLGSCLAASLAYRGFDVIGFDINNISEALLDEYLW